MKNTLIKKVLTSCATFALVFNQNLLTLPAKAQTADSSTNSDSELAKTLQPIVKIQTYINSSYGRLILADQGSGVIISADGIVLTNAHVVQYERTFDNKIVPSASEICFLGTSTYKEPDCTATADVIAINKTLDVAILKIKPVSTIGLTAPYPYFDLAPADTTKLNDTLYAFGYQNIGSGNIVASKGVLNSKRNTPDGKFWLKVNNSSSYGSSGGPVIDEQNQIVGLTTAVSGDSANSLSDVLSVDSFFAWVNTNKSGLPITNPLNDRLAKFTKNALDIISNKSNTFSIFNPTMTVTKPTGWTFKYSDEQSLYIADMSDPTGGEIIVSIYPTPGKVTINSIEPKLADWWAEEGSLQLREILSKTPMTFGSQKGYRIKVAKAGKIIDTIVLAADRYLVEIAYAYGENNKDQKNIEGIISSLKFGPNAANGKIVSDYRNTNPTFKLKFGKEWAIATLNNPTNPLEGLYNPNPNVFFNVKVDKLKPSEMNISNENRLKLALQTIATIRQALKVTDADVNIIKTNPRLKLNKEIGDASMNESTVIKLSTKKVLLYNKEYEIWRGDKHISFSLNVYSNDKKVQRQAAKDFDKLMATLSLK